MANVVGMVAAGVLAALIGCRDESECRGDVAHICGSYNEGTEWRCHDADCGAMRKYCVESDDGQAFCALSPTPRTDCVGHWACDGASTIVTCSYGYAISTMDCAPGFCVPGVGWECAVREGIDPGCEALAMYEGYDELAYCDGDLRVTCRGGYAMEVEDCGPNRCWQPEAAWFSGRCMLSETPDARCTMMEPYPYVVCDDGTQLVCGGPYLLSETACTTTNCSTCN